MQGVPYAAKEQHAVSNPRAGESMVVGQSVLPPETKQEPGKQSKAALSKTAGLSLFGSHPGGTRSHLPGNRDRPGTDGESFDCGQGPIEEK